MVKVYQWGRREEEIFNTRYNSASPFKKAAVKDLPVEDVDDSEEVDLKQMESDSKKSKKKN